MLLRHSALVHRMEVECLGKAGTMVGVRAMAIPAGPPGDFLKQYCYFGRLQVLVPAEWVDALLPGTFMLQQQLLRVQPLQASSKSELLTSLCWR
jgi:hypothetical protein